LIDLDFKTLVLKTHQLQKKDFVKLRFKEINKNYFTFRKKRRLLYSIKNHLPAAEIIKENYNVEAIAIFTSVKALKRIEEDFYLFELFLKWQNTHFLIKCVYTPGEKYLHVRFCECDENFNTKWRLLEENEKELKEFLLNIYNHFKLQILNFLGEDKTLRLDLVTGNYRTNLLI
jgi:hypothetical protein